MRKPTAANAPGIHPQAAPACMKSCGTQTRLPTGAARGIGRAFGNLSTAPPVPPLDQARGGVGIYATPASPLMPGSLPPSASRSEPNGTLSLLWQHVPALGREGGTTRQAPSRLRTVPERPVGSLLPGLGRCRTHRANQDAGTPQRDFPPHRPCREGDQNQTQSERRCGQGCGRASIGL